MDYIKASAKKWKRIGNPDTSNNIQPMLRREVTYTDTLEKRKRYSMTGSKQTAILVYVRA